AHRRAGRSRLHRDQAEADGRWNRPVLRQRGNECVAGLRPRPGLYLHGASLHGSAQTTARVSGVRSAIRAGPDAGAPGGIAAGLTPPELAKRLHRLALVLQLSIVGRSSCDVSELLHEIEESVHGLLV